MLYLYTALISKVIMMVNSYSPHKQDMSRITYINVGKKTQNERHSKDGKYITVSKEGRVCFWKSDLTLQRSELVRPTI